MTAHPIDITARAVVEDTEREHLAASNDNAPERERSMTGFLATLPPAQQEAAIVYRGPDTHPARIGDWMQTYTGRAVYPMDLRPEDVDARDIAHSLANQCRYAGHCLRFYSVAEHSVHVARWLLDNHGPKVALEGLLHDATEAYLVDVPRPVKPFLTGYKEAERRVAHAIAEAFGLDMAGHPEVVHEADNRILHDERAQAMSPCSTDWKLAGRELGVTLQFWGPKRAKEQFLEMLGRVG